jgi:hypothetical protein
MPLLGRLRRPFEISTSEDASGLTVAGPTQTKDTYVILQSKDAVSSLKLRSEDGREQIIRP